MDPSGIVYHTKDSSGQRIEQLPLEEVKINILIVDVTARITLTQHFLNPSSSSTGRSKYCFPVPASAAVCAFEMFCSNGRTLKGECKEKDVAREQYQSAIASGNMAGLVDYVTDDVFTISLGSVLPQTVVKTKVTYVMTLRNGDRMDEVSLQLPMHVGQRYGTPPVAMDSSAHPTSHTKVSITTHIQMAGRINQIRSPSHPTEIAETRYSTHLGRLSRRRTTIRFNSHNYLERDFVLAIQAEGLDSPRCFAELRRGSRHKYPDTIALQLTMVPKTKLPAIDEQEYIFVVDRSGSMSGPRIEIATRTLAMMLRMLPAKGSLFNVFSFGDQVEQIWHASRVYSQETLLEATICIEKMEANLGGTNIQRALEKVFASCSHSHECRPTAIFLLTDGYVWSSTPEGDSSEVIKHIVKKFVVKSAKPRRVFTLGIGDSVSSDMCEGIARAGNGICLFAVTAESIAAQCARLFRAGRTPFVRDIVLDWGVPLLDNHTGVAFSNQPSPGNGVALPTVQQVPFKVHDIHSGTRLNVFAIISLKKWTAPRFVVLSGKFDSDNIQEFRLEIPVREIQLVDSERGSPLIHTMAAWGLIQEQAERVAPVPSVHLPTISLTETEARKSVIVQLGVHYQLATPYTSFIAVEGIADMYAGFRMRQKLLAWDPRRSEIKTDAEEPAVVGLNRIASTIWKVCRNLVSGFATIPPLAGANFQSLLGSSWLGKTTDFTPVDEGDISEGDRSSVQTFSTLSSLERTSDISGWSSAPSHFSEEGNEEEIPSPLLEPLDLAPETERSRHAPKGDVLTVEASVSADVVEFVKLQQFDGSFIIDRHFEKLVGTAAVEEGRKLQVDDATWATLLYVAFLRKNLQGSPELLEDLLVKSMEFIIYRGVENVESLIEKAAAIQL